MRRSTELDAGMLDFEKRLPEMLLAPNMAPENLREVMRRTRQTVAPQALRDRIARWQRPPSCLRQPARPALAGHGGIGYPRGGLAARTWLALQPAIQEPIYRYLIAITNAGFCLASPSILHLPIVTRQTWFATRFALAPKCWTSQTQGFPLAGGRIDLSRGSTPSIYRTTSILSA